MLHTIHLHRGDGARSVAITISVAALMVFCLPALAQSADLQRCRELKDAAARLACYDAIPLTAPARPQATAPVAAGSSVVPSSTPATAAPAARAPQTEDQFGLERKTEQQLVKSIESRIVGKFDGWEPSTRFTLENGQVWQVSDDSRAFGNLTNPRVKLTRGTFGTFFLEIQGINAAPRVKRVK